MKIISKYNSKIKFLKSLNLKKHRSLHKQFLVEGFHLVTMAKQANCLKEVFVVKGADFTFANKTFISFELIKKISQHKSPQPIIGLVSMKKTEFTQDNFIVLDHIQDPGNVGAILRSALAFGIKNIVLSKKSADLYNFKTINASQGAIFKLNIKKMNIISFLQNYHEQIIASVLNKQAITLDKFKTKNKFALVVGNEGQGIRTEIQKLADILLMVPIKNINSLNVVVSTGIILYNLCNIKNENH